ncbi:MAG: succinate dehydrogenase assembly factor 2 [Methyloprofundus sp.]|nr:succinate dehydrogenase assembly factor 2 [Methyloprofundus sp.]
MSALRWQCRRGAKELDAFLCAYLDKAYSNANAEEQALFIDLLALEDSLLLAYFFAHETPKKLELNTIVEKVRACATN